MLWKLRNFLKKKKKNFKIEIFNVSNDRSRSSLTFYRVSLSPSLSLSIYLFSRHPNTTYIASTIIYQLYRRLQQRYYNIGGTIRLVSTARLKISIVGFLDTVITLSIWHTVMQFIFFPYWLCLRETSCLCNLHIRSSIEGNNISLEIYEEKEISRWIIGRIYWISWSLVDISSFSKIPAFNQYTTNRIPIRAYHRLCN